MNHLKPSGPPRRHGAGFASIDALAHISRQGEPGFLAVINRYAPLGMTRRSRRPVAGGVYPGGTATPVDILINNVGIFGPRDFFETPDTTWTEFFEVNVMSGVRLSRAYLPGMVEREWGRVLFIFSESALNIPPDMMIHYGFTKTAHLSISRGLAKRVAGYRGHGHRDSAGSNAIRRVRGHGGHQAAPDETAEEKARAFVMEQLHYPAGSDRG